MSDIPRVVYQLSPRSDDGLSLDPMDQMDQMGNSLPRWERRINRSGAHPMAEHKSRSDRDDMNVANSSESRHNQDNFFRRPNTNILVYDEDRGRNSNLHNRPERRSCLVKQSPARHNGIEKISLPSCRSPREMRLSKDLTQQMTKSHLKSRETIWQTSVSHRRSFPTRFECARSWVCCPNCCSQLVQSFRSPSC